MHTLSSWYREAHYNRYQAVCTCGRMTNHHSTLNRAINEHQDHEHSANRSRTLELIGA